MMGDIFLVVLLLLALNFTQSVLSLDSSAETWISKEECYMQSSERIITDREIMESPDGVRVDYSYNETKPSFFSDDSNLTNSAPGCPRSVNGTPWVQYGDPPRCYFPGNVGPCGGDQVLVQKSPNSYIAECVCNWPQYVDLKPLIKSDDGKFIVNWDEYNQIYDLEKKVCYRVGEQGPCEEGNVLLNFENMTTVKCVADMSGICDAGLVFNANIGKCKKPDPDDDPVDEIGEEGAAPDAIGPNECSDDERYDTALERCLKSKGVSHAF